ESAAAEVVERERVRPPGAQEADADVAWHIDIPPALDAPVADGLPVAEDRDRGPLPPRADLGADGEGWVGEERADRPLAVLAGPDLEAPVDGAVEHLDDLAILPRSLRAQRE